MSKKTDRREQIKKIVQIVSHGHIDKLELELLNKKYGNKVTPLTKPQRFECRRCGYKGQIIPQKKILKGEYGIKPLPVVNMETGITLYYAYWLVYVVQCRCSGNEIVYGEIGVDHALKLLREERDFFEKGKKRPYESMIV